MYSTIFDRRRSVVYFPAREPDLTGWIVAYNLLSRQRQKFQLPRSADVLLDAVRVPAGVLIAYSSGGPCQDPQRLPPKTDARGPAPVNVHRFPPDPLAGPFDSVCFATLPEPAPR